MAASPVEAVPAGREGCAPFTFVFVGTGVSTGLPVPRHPLDTKEPCACAAALADPAHSPNWRNNVSLMILPPASTTPPVRTAEVVSGDEVIPGLPAGVTLVGKRESPDGGGRDFILIDCGKTFRDAYFRTMRRWGVTQLRSLLLTHEHADAVNGIDDLRDFQDYRSDAEYKYCVVDQPMLAYMSAFTKATLTRSIPYIVNPAVPYGPAHELADAIITGETRQTVAVSRRRLILGIVDIDDTQPQPLKIAGMPLAVPCWSFPVFHGDSYVSLGFVFGAPAASSLRDGASSSATRRDCVVYLSDVSAVPDATMVFLRGLGTIDVFVVDCLLGPGEKHFSHWCVDQAWDAIVALQPRQTFCVGMYCDLEHERTNAMWTQRLARYKRENNPTSTIEAVACAFDGQSFVSWM